MIIKNGRLVGGGFEKVFNPKKQVQQSQEHKFEREGLTYPEYLYCKICGASKSDHRL